MSTETELRQELAALGLRELRERAVEDGVDEDDIEDARDGDEPKEMLIALIVAESRFDGQQLGLGQLGQLDSSSSGLSSAESSGDDDYEDDGFEAASPHEAGPTLAKTGSDFPSLDESDEDEIEMSAPAPASGADFDATAAGPRTDSGASSRSGQSNSDEPLNDEEAAELAKIEAELANLGVANSQLNEQREELESQGSALSAEINEQAVAAAASDEDDEDDLAARYPKTVAVGMAASSGQADTPEPRHADITDATPQEEEVAVAAATRIQARQRGQRERQALAEQQQATTRIQAVQRGKASRRQQQPNGPSAPPIGAQMTATTTATTTPTQQKAAATAAVPALTSDMKGVYTAEEKEEAKEKQEEEKEASAAAVKIQARQRGAISFE